MQEGILRQRRNLLSVSIILWIMKYGEVTFAKLSLSGLEISVKNPDAILTALWISFFYFLFRYYQYFSNDGVTALKECLENSLEEKCEGKIKEIVKRKFPNSNKLATYKYSILKSNNWFYHGQDMKKNATGMEVSDNFRIKIQQRELYYPITLSLFEITFRKSVVTDYLLPFALSIFILLYCGGADWNGSYMRLILN